MAYYNIDSLKLNEEKFPYIKENVDQQINYIKNGNKGLPLLVDVDLNVIGNQHSYYAIRELRKKAIYGQRIIHYEDNPVYPDRFSIEISSKCNYNCKMCPRTVLKREQGYMESSLFYKIVDDIKQHKVKMVDLYRLGESTYHPEFRTFIEYLNKLKEPLPSCLSSNGGLLTEELLEFVMNSSITFFNISVNAFNNETYQVITGGKGDFSQISRIINIAKKMKKRRTPFFGIQFIEQDITHNRINEFIEEHIEFVDFIESSMLEDFGKQITQNIEYIEKNHFYTDRVIKRIPCQRSIWGRFRIYSNGDVVPCICDINAEFLKMGNIRKDTISEIFNSENWKTFKKMHKDVSCKDHPLCGPCTEWMIYSDYNKKHKVYLKNQGVSDDKNN